ncbi:MAG: hypothetical protein Q9187_008963 [Circinaria calcarea]
MPVLPSEEEAPSGITETVAKNPSSATGSTASDHPRHDSEDTPVKPQMKDFQSKGPAIPQTMDDVPPVVPKEELRAKAAELNK